MSSSPSTNRKDRARPTCNMLDQSINFFRLILSANNPLIGWDMANKAILTENKIPNKNSEPENSRIKKNNAIVLNHSPNNEMTDAAHKRLNLGLE